LDTSLVLYLNNQWMNVDLYDDIPISLMIQETDITDLQARKSAYTKQFTVPGTSNNCKIFEEYYEVNGIDFNPLVKNNPVVVGFIFIGVPDRMNGPMLKSCWVALPFTPMVAW